MKEKRNFENLEQGANVASTQINAQNKAKNNTAFQKFCKKYFRKVDDADYEKLKVLAKARNVAIAALTAPFVVVPASALVYIARKSAALHELKQNNPNILLDELNKYVAEFNAKHNETLSVPETNHVFFDQTQQTGHQIAKDTAVEDVTMQLLSVRDGNQQVLFDAGLSAEVTQSLRDGAGKMVDANALIQNLISSKGEFYTTVTQNYNALAETTGAYANLMLESAIGAGVAYGAIVAPFAVRYLYYRNKLAKSKGTTAQNNQEDLTK